MSELPPIYESAGKKMGIVLGFESPSQEGIPIGQEVTVEPETSSLLVSQGKVIAALPPGVHRLDPSSIPELEPFINSNANGDRTVQVALWKIKTEKVVAEWQSERILARKESGVTADCILHGTCWLRVADPSRFYSAFIAQVHRVKELQANLDALTAEFPSLIRGGRNAEELAKGSLTDLMDVLVLQTIEREVDAASEEARLRGGEDKDFLEPLRAHAGTAVAQALSGVGIQCEAFGIDRVERHAAVCRACSAAEPEPGYDVPLCGPCRATLIKRPFPVWVLGTSALVVLLLVVSFMRFPSSVQAGVAFERGKHNEDQKNYPAALVQYKKVLSKFPDSIQVQARYGIAQYRSGNIDAALEAFSKLEGKDVGKDLKTEIDGILEELDRLVAEEKAKKGKQK